MVVTQCRIFAVVLLSFSLCAGQTPKPEERLDNNATRYKSQALNALVTNAIADMKGDKPERMLNALNLFADLRRGDLLVLGMLHSGELVYRKTLELASQLPIEEQKTFLVMSLSNDTIFRNDYKSYERTEWRKEMIEHYKALLKQVSKDVNLGIDVDNLDLDSADSRRAMKSALSR